MAFNARKAYRSIPLASLRSQFDVGLPELLIRAAYCAPHFQPYYKFVCCPMYPHRNCLCAQKSTNITNLGKEYTRIVSDARMHGFGRYNSEYLVDLFLIEPKYICNTCIDYHIFSHNYDCIQPGYDITKRLFQQIGRDSYFYSQRDLAEKYGVSKTLVNKIHAATDKFLKEQLPPSQAPQDLAIFHISIPGKKGFSVLLDAATGLSVGTTESNSHEVIAKGIQAMQGFQNIRRVYTSMGSSYQTTIRQLLPDAKHIVDKYSVYQELENRYQKLISDHKAVFLNNTLGAVDETLVKEAANLLSHLHPISRCFPQFDKAQKTYPHRNKIMEQFPDIAFLLEFEWSFFQIYSSQTRDEALKKYVEWRKLLPPNGKRKIEEWEDDHKISISLYKPLADFGKLTRNWEAEILNCFDDFCRDSRPVIMHTDFAATSINISYQLSSFTCSTVRTRWDHWSALKNPITFAIMGWTPDNTECLPYEDYWRYCRKKGLYNHYGPVRFSIVETTKHEEQKPICVFDYQFPEQYYSLLSEGVLL